MLPTMLLIGLAFGLGFTSLSIAATTGVRDEEQGRRAGAAACGELSEPAPRTEPAPLTEPVLE